MTAKSVLVRPQSLRPGARAPLATPLFPPKAKQSTRRGGSA